MKRYLWLKVVGIFICTLLVISTLYLNYQSKRPQPQVNQNDSKVQQFENRRPVSQVNQNDSKTQQPESVHKKYLYTESVGVSTRDRLGFSIEIQQDQILITSSYKSQDPFEVKLPFDKDKFDQLSNKVNSYGLKNTKKDIKYFSEICSGGSQYSLSFFDSSEVFNGGYVVCPSEDNVKDNMNRAEDINLSGNVDEAINTIKGTVPNLYDILRALYSKDTDFKENIGFLE